MLCQRFMCQQTRSACLSPPSLMSPCPPAPAPPALFHPCRASLEPEGPAAATQGGQAVLGWAEGRGALFPLCDLLAGAHLSRRLDPRGTRAGRGGGAARRPLVQQPGCLRWWWAGKQGHCCERGRAGHGSALPACTACATCAGGCVSPAMPVLPSPAWGQPPAAPHQSPPAPARRVPGGLRAEQGAGGGRVAVCRRIPQQGGMLTQPIPAHRSLTPSAPLARTRGARVEEAEVEGEVGEVTAAAAHDGHSHVALLTRRLQVRQAQAAARRGCE